MDSNVEIKDEVGFDKTVTIKNENEFEGICKLEEDENTAFEIKTEPMLKSECEVDDSETGDSWRKARKDYAIINTNEIVLENTISVKHDESAIYVHNCNCKVHGNENLRQQLISEQNRNLIGNYVCSQCNCKIHNQTYVNNEMEPKSDISAIKKFNCYHCQFMTDFKASLIRHIRVKHNKNILIKIYFCDHCDYNNPDKSNLNSHVLLKHDENAIKKDNCNLCDYKTTNKYFLMNHILIKHGENTIKKYNCHLCDYKTTNKYFLMNHILIKHGERVIKKYNCTLCDYNTYHKNHLNSHILAKHKEVTLKDTVGLVTNKKI